MRLWKEYRSNLERSPDDMTITDTDFIEKHLDGSGDWPNLVVVRNNPVYGNGVLATQTFQPGRVICNYHGKYISEAEFNKAYDLAKDGIGRTDYHFGHVTNPKFFIDASEPDETKANGFYGRLLNHSRLHPNIEPKVYTRKHPELYNHPHCLIFVAKTKIEIGEQLLWDYGDLTKLS